MYLLHGRKPGDCLQRSHALTSVETTIVASPTNSETTFNEATLSRAWRLGHLPDGPQRHDDPSTKPRSHERGDLLSIAKRSEAKDPSTKPRSHERGDEQTGQGKMFIFDPSTKPRSHERGDAADVGKWKVLIGPSTKPRSHERGDRECTCCHGGGRHCLQRSHALTSVETGMSGLGRADPDLLQRSHALTSVETRLGSARSARYLGTFNEATLSRAWRRGGGGAPMAASMSLQRSHALTSVETRGLHPLLRAAGDPSTKPRSHERGDLRMPWGSQATIWASFNEATLSRAWRPPARWEGWGSSRRPSTKPRSHERGDRSIPKAIPRGYAPSTKPRSHERGDGPSERQTHQPLHPSTKPRSHERGDAGR